MPQTFIKHPDESKFYRIDLKGRTNGNDPAARSDYLEAALTISTATLAADTGITVGSPTLDDDDSSVIFRVSGGTANADYKVECTMVDSGGETHVETVTFKVRA